MKCTNKCLALLTALAVCFGATGCSDEAIAFSYNPDYKVSAFRISGDTGFETADAFASGLCVVNGDINTDNSAVDMTDATSAGLFDLNSRTVLYAKNIHERLAPASLTKLMTAVVALKYGNPNDVITVSSNMGNLESGAVVCGLAEGDQLTLNQALHALLIKSANDAAVAIAEHIGGSVEGFADMMNEEAQAIGATNSHFVNPHGLNAENHYVTAYDMYLIFNEALKYDTVNEIISMTSYDTVYTDKNGNEKTLSVKNTNQYLAGNVAAPDRVTVIGGKTGTTDDAGYCFTSAYNRDGDEIYTVILNSTTTDQRFTDTATLANWYYGHKVTVAIANTQEKTANGNPLMARIGQTDWTDKTIDATLADPTAQATVFSLAGEVTEKVSHDDLSGTVHVGDKVGSVTLKQDGTKIAVMDLVADEEGAGPNPIEWLLVKLDRLGRRIDNRPLTAESETVAKAPEV